MIESHMKYGHGVARLWIQTGMGDDLKKIIEDAESKQLSRRVAGSAALLGAALTFAGVVRVAKSSGIDISLYVPPDEEILYEESRGNSVAYYGLMGSLMQVVHEMKRAYPMMSVAWQKKDAQMPDSDASKPTRSLTDADLAAIVAATGKEQTGPLDVRIISLPARETTSTITRDERGQIQQSSQLEVDVLP